MQLSVPPIPPGSSTRCNSLTIRLRDPAFSAASEDIRAREVPASARARRHTEQRWASSTNTHPSSTVPVPPVIAIRDACPAAGSPVTQHRRTRDYWALSVRRASNVSPAVDLEPVGEMSVRQMGRRVRSYTCWHAASRRSSGAARDVGIATPADHRRRRAHSAAMGIPRCPSPGTNVCRPSHSAVARSFLNLRGSS